MICPNCLRHVPDLIGPEQLCIECIGLTGEDLIPSLFAECSAEEGRWLEDVPESLESILPDLAGSTVGDCFDLHLDSDLLPDTDETLEGLDPPPTFRGVRRF